ncbi:MAG: dephospho-CoA kinase [Polyangiales bacterium]
MAKRVGLTGGIATGKSAVAGFFRARGIPVVDADQVARDVVQPGEPALAEIVKTFGGEVLEGEALDRKKLGALVFADESARKKLNAIIHPRIAMESQRQLNEASKLVAPYVLYEAALLVENKIHTAFAALVVVSVPDATQLERLMKRDSSDVASARARIASQMPLAEKEALADYLITNDGTLEETEEQVQKVHEALIAQFTDV